MGKPQASDPDKAPLSVKDWLWRLDCVERQLEQMPAFRDLRLYCQLDFGGILPDDRGTFPIWGKRLGRSEYGKLAVRGWHTTLPRLKSMNCVVGFEACGKAYFFEDEAFCRSIKDNVSIPDADKTGLLWDHPMYCDAERDGVCAWETWYYLDPESARGRERRYWEPQEIEALEQFDKAVWDCIAEQAAGFGITKSWEFLWGGILIVLAMMKAHPLLQLSIMECSNPEDPPWNSYHLHPDYVSATRYAFEAFRRLAREDDGSGQGERKLAKVMPEEQTPRPDTEKGPKRRKAGRKKLSGTKEQPWADDAPESPSLPESPDDGGPFYKPAHFTKWNIGGELVRRNSTDGKKYIEGKVRRQKQAPRTGKKAKRPTYWYSEPDAKKCWPDKFASAKA